MAKPADAIAHILSMLGTHEQPPGSNHVPGITDFLHTANGTGTGDSPWCAETQSRILSDVGVHDFYGRQFVNGIAYVPYITNLARATGRFIPPASGEPGDLPIFVWGGKGSDRLGDHVGMLRYGRNPATGLYGTVEGNASEGTPIGDCIGEHQRSISVILGFYRPAWGQPAATPVPRPTPPPPPPPSLAPAYPGYMLHLTSPLMQTAGCALWQRRMNVRGAFALAVDGVYGPLSAAACRALQVSKRLTPDGIVGPITWAATWTL